MQPNPVLRKLGFSDNDRVVIIHADDVGMCQASVQAFTELSAFGLVSCGAVMVPCPWFPKAAEYARQNPQVDLGIHLTLTCEWDFYRWGPISTRDPQSGLMDAEGFFPRRSAEVQGSLNPVAAQRELCAQVERAVAFGIRPSHIDTHMGNVIHPSLIQAYVNLGVQNRLPLMLLRMDAPALQHLGLDSETAAGTAVMIQQLEEQGFPLLDRMFGMPLEIPGQRFETAKAAFAALQPGITHFIIHPAVDTPELRAITPDWPSRNGDYQTFLREDLASYLRQIGIQVIGYNPMKQLLQP